MDRGVTPKQREVLQWIADGCPAGKWDPEDYSYKMSSAALANRRLICQHGRGRNWAATITDDGTYFLEHGQFPDGHPLAPKPKVTPKTQGTDSNNHEAKKRPTAAARRPRRGRVKPPPEPEFEIDSPKNLRGRGRDVTRDLPDSVKEHPWDGRVLISVKEAAWLLSVSEALIRDAVLRGDIQRVYIGTETSRYRIVHASLLAWVNTMPTESSRYYRW